LDKKKPEWTPPKYTSIGSGTQELIDNIMWFHATRTAGEDTMTVIPLQKRNCYSNATTASTTLTYDDEQPMGTRTVQVVVQLLLMRWITLVQVLPVVVILEPAINSLIYR
jgi:hypothetical protein